MTLSNLIRVLAGVLTILTWSTASGESGWEPAGYWSGQLEYRGDLLEVHIRIGHVNEIIEAQLDIPALVYARQAMPVTFGDDYTLSLEFPFGIGAITVGQKGPQQLAGERGEYSLRLARAMAPQRVAREIEFGAFEPKLNGTLFLPPGNGPHPVVVLIAGSGNITRESWSYASWVDVYLQQGVGAFVYDRREDMAPLPDGSIARIEDHAADVLDAIRQIRAQADVDAGRTGLAGASRGAWIAMSVARQLPDLSFLLFSSPAAATPGEQETRSVLTGMRQDGLSPESISRARAYLRLYFYVAQTGAGWDLLASAIAAGADSNWLQYVDQPRAPEDLHWWRNNMNFDAISHLQDIRMPVLALWGAEDFITPWADYRLKLESALESAGNEDFSTKVFAGADHRLEVGFGEDESGKWHWFGLAPGALGTIEAFVRHTTRLR